MSPSIKGHDAPPGFVSLIGAGPGHPKLITRLGFERLQACDVLVYDRLIPMELLDQAKPACERIDVGKLPGSVKVPQEEINRILVEKALKGGHVARLKGGDPSIFGRVGEEAAALREAGISFEIIPGITAGSAAAASAGFPLTHRGCASSVTFATLHEDPTREESFLDWGALAHSGTLVFYMPGGYTREVSGNLIESGHSPESPVVIVQNASCHGEKIIAGRLKSLADGSLAPTKGQPSVVVVGNVAGLAHFTESKGGYPFMPIAKPLVILTHPVSPEPDRLQLGLSESGVDVLHWPAVEIALPEDRGPLERCVGSLPGYDWVLFTSKNAVDSFMAVLFEMGFDARQFGACRIGVVGAATEKALSRYSLKADLMPAESYGRALAQALISNEDIRSQRIFFPASEIAREELPALLREAGANLEIAVAYRTVAFQGVWEGEEQAFERGIAAVCFTSPSAVKNFGERVAPERLKNLQQTAVAASIGKTTTQALSEAGWARIIQSETSSYDALAECLRQSL